MSGTCLSAAKKRGIPHLIHEQNAYPGRNNRFMARGAGVVYTVMSRRRRFKRAHKEFNWQPVREVLQS